MRAVLEVCAAVLAYLGRDFGTGRDYANWTPSDPSIVPLNDVALNFYLRAILELDCTRAVEIGAGNRSRCIALKRLLPFLEVKGLDIGPDFSEWTERDGCRFGPYSELEAHCGAGTIILATGTLTCMTPNEVAKVLAFAKRTDAALAAVEPSRSRPGPRQGGNWYHNLSELAKAEGLEVLFHRLVAKNSFSLKMLEHRQHIICK